MERPFCFWGRRDRRPTAPGALNAHRRAIPTPQFLTQPKHAPPHEMIVRDGMAVWL